jgi:hypothetical protein
VKSRTRAATGFARALTKARKIGAQRDGTAPAYAEGMADNAFPFLALVSALALATFLVASVLAHVG